MLACLLLVMGRHSKPKGAEVHSFPICRSLPFSVLLTELHMTICMSTLCDSQLYKPKLLCRLQTPQMAFPSSSGPELNS